MSVLITGASGFIGRNLAKRLLDRQEQVVLFDRHERGVGLEGARFIGGDIRSAVDVDRAFAAAPIDRAIHAAALTPDTTAEAEDPALIVDVNVRGTVELMRGAHRAGVRRVLGISSVAVYGSATGSTDGALHEDATMCLPTSLYGTTKWAAERIVHRLGILYGIETATVRLGACFGVEEHPTGVRTMMSPHWQCAEAARGGREIVLDRPMCGDWLDAGDAAAAIVRLLDLPILPSTLFNLGGGSLTSVASWCEVLSAIHPGFHWRVDAAAATIRYGLECDRAPMGMSRLRAAIGVVPFTGGLQARVQRYMAWRNSIEGVALCGP